MRWTPLLSAYITACLLGLALDVGVLELLVTAGCGVHVARLISIIPATLAVYLLHSRYAFAAYKDVRTAQGKPVPFGALAAASVILNYAIFMRVLRIPEPPVGAVARAASVTLGTIAAYGANWALLQSILEKAKPVAGKEADTPPRAMMATGGLRRAAIWVAALFMVFDAPRQLHQLHDITLFPNLAFPLEPADTDVWLRLTQVRQWLAASWANGGFFDHHVVNTNAPIGGVSTPWTRPVDFILAGLTRLMPAADGMTKQLMLAALWMPALLTAVNLLILNRAAALHNKLSSAIGVTVLLFMLSDFYYLAPGNTDHHGILSVLWCAAIWLLLAEKYAALAGAALGLSIWISPEALITTGFIFAVMGVEGLYYPDKMRRLFYAATAAAATCAIGLFVEIPAGEILSRQTYDTLSMVQECLLLLTAVAAGFLALVFLRLGTLRARLAAAAVGGAAVLVGEYIFFPGFFAGPMRDVDGIVFSKMLPKITEAKSLFAQHPFIILQVIMWVVPSLLVLADVLRRKHRFATQRHAVILMAALLGMLALTLVQTRWQYYLQPIAVLTLASFLPVQAMGAKKSILAFMRGTPRWARVYVLCWMIYLVTMLGIKAVAPGEPTAKAYCFTQLRYVLQTGELQSLLGPQPLVILAPRDLGGEMQFFTPYRIIASNYHREGAGLEDMMAIEAAPTGVDALALLKKRDVGAIFTCPGTYDDDSWLHALDTNTPKWLAPVAIPTLIKMQGDKPKLFTLHIDK